jgi:hypothetical protein
VYILSGSTNEARRWHNVLVLRAKLRQRHDRDIELAVEGMNLEKGEMSDLVRDGVRLRLIELGELTKTINGRSGNNGKDIRHPQNSENYSQGHKGS